MFILIIQRVILEALLDLFYFPIWWYTGGVKFIVGKIWSLVQAGNAELLPGLWLVNIFVPMYGQYDWQGRMISFFMRSVNIIGRSLALLIWTVACVALFLAWLAFPVVIVNGLLAISPK
ncbi:MAG: hypothetical protein Q7S66_03035 [bacterium]|nr:hypothetical protein [bacterium]